MAVIKGTGVKPQVHVDIEKLRHCEELADGSLVEFIRIFRYENGVLVLPPTDVTLDGSAPYVVVDEANVKICETPASDQCFPVKKFLFDTESTGQGVTEKYWERFADGSGFGSPTVGTTQNPASIEDAFQLKDACGLPLHINDADAIINILPTTTPTDPSGNEPSHQNELDFWVCIDRPGVSLSARVNGYSSFAVYFGSCNSKLRLIESGINTTAAGTAFYDVPLGQVGQGFFHCRLYTSDPSQFGKTKLSWDIGNGFEDIPTENLIPVRPAASCVDLLWNKTQEKYFQINADGTTGEELDTTKFKCFSCDPCSVPDGSVPQVDTGDTLVSERVLCDKALTGEETKFVQHTVYNSDGSVASTYNTTLLDPTVEYVPSGIVRDCEEQCHTEAFWNQTIQVTDSAVVSLDLTGIDGNGEYCAPRCAQIQVLGGGGWFTVHDNAEPSWDGDLVGHYVPECEWITLGCCPDSLGCIEELERFKIIADEGETLRIVVTYYRDKL